MLEEFMKEYEEAFFKESGTPTCSDCAHWNYCKKFLAGEIDGSETECDWYPSRFKFKEEVSTS